MDSAPPPSLQTAARRPRRRWRAKFGDAGRGVKLGVRGHSSFFVHFFCAALVLTAAAALQCDLLEWAVLIAAVGGVITTELFNSALETLVHGLDAATKQRLKGVLDVAAGAVLVAAGTAALVGGLVLGNRLWIVVVR
ncbi:MAG TPA: diacylglycerol kinase [Gemmataceae bacterium]|nr:diacylglycerol kinase [Gemmataceae bacterium]